jgi:hypothetical protein
MKDFWQPKALILPSRDTEQSGPVFWTYKKEAITFQELAFHGTPPQNRIASRDPSSKKTGAI